MINNISKIKKLLSFNSQDDFYHLQIIKRKKEHKELRSNSMIVKTYYIKSIEHLEKVFPEIKCISDFHNARACINLNKRSFEKCSYQTLIKITGQIMNKDFKSSRKAFESVCGANSNEKEKKWIIDIDKKDDFVYGNFIVDRLKEIKPIGDKFIEVLETKNGYHLIVKPFNISEAKFIQDEIHKDNPTILYIP